MIDTAVRELATGVNFAAMTTLMRDGSAQTSVVWVDADAEHFLVNTEVHRLKYRNLQRDGRVNLMIIDQADPYRYVEVRGHLVNETHGDAARAHIDALSERYHGRPYTTPIQSERVVLAFAPDHVFARRL